MRWIATFGTGMIAIGAAAPAAAQVAGDRADPSIVTRSLPNLDGTPLQSPPPGATPAPVLVPQVGLAEVGVRVRAIVIDGRDEVPESAFAPVIAPYFGRPLSPADLRALAGGIADVARGRGLVFATASIPAQSLRGGTLRVTLDEGRIDAVRTIGTSNAAADRILGRLVTRRGVQKAALESAILLVGDIAGVSVTDSRYVRQDGFGILLVTIRTDRASAYAQIDNRGTDEIGPYRSTVLGSVRGVIAPGDEIGLLVSQTPFDPKEFMFLSGRYAVPVGARGGVVTASAYRGWTRAGGSLKDFDLKGDSVGGSIGYRTPLLRSRARSLWAGLDLRAISVDQSLRGRPIRRDDLVMLTGTVDGAGKVLGGTLRGAVQVVGGLPVAGTTRAGDPLASRRDGSSRFVTGSVEADWTRPLGGPFSLRLDSFAQLASRPLLASPEVGLGGPAFGRAYDYSERTGDQGVLGSAELRVDMGKVAPVLSRLQFYGFMDGGVVDNLRGGRGGGSLASGGGGARVGRGRIDAGLEVALPLTSDRIDSGNRDPRVSGRVAVRF